MKGVREAGGTTSDENESDLAINIRATRAATSATERKCGGAGGCDGGGLSRASRLSGGSTIFRCWNSPGPHFS